MSAKLSVLKNGQFGFCLTYCITSRTPPRYQTNLRESSFSQIRANSFPFFFFLATKKGQKKSENYLSGQGIHRWNFCVYVMFFFLRLYYRNLYKWWSKWIFWAMVCLYGISLQFTLTSTAKCASICLSTIYKRNWSDLNCFSSLFSFSFFPPFLAA